MGLMAQITNRVAVMPTAFELQYYAEARWTERAPRMVQTLIAGDIEAARQLVVETIAVLERTDPGGARPHPTCRSPVAT